MAGEERGGLFAFFALTIGLSVALTLGIGLLHYKSELEKARPTESKAGNLNETRTNLNECINRLTEKVITLENTLGVKVEELEPLKKTLEKAPEKKTEPSEKSKPDQEEPEEGGR